MPWIIGGATLASGALGAGSSKKAGGQASSAAKQAAAQQQQMYLQTRADLAPFVGAGRDVLGQTRDLATSGPFGGLPNYLDVAGRMFPGGGTGQGGFTQAELEATPGYQFDLSQGLKATQAAAAARGLGVSGASLKGAAAYATGLADKTYQNQFDIQNKRFSDVLNLNTAERDILGGQYTRLHDTAALGANAAAQTGTAGTSAAATAGNYLNAAGVDTATASRNAGNALSGAFNNIAGYYGAQNIANNNALTSNYGNQVGTTGLTASGNPAMTGFAPAYTMTPAPGGGYTYG